MKLKTNEPIWYYVYLSMVKKKINLNLIATLK